mmetsp:Transcript_11642/g.41550  ORF Transcript_11642/g.41550 Transcript_11642/m.41550 type:complete len:306 (+) Transcript_11642:1252-2169(+)
MLAPLLRPCACGAVWQRGIGRRAGSARRRCAIGHAAVLQRCCTLGVTSSEQGGSWRRGLGRRRRTSRLSGAGRPWLGFVIALLAAAATLCWRPTPPSSSPGWRRHEPRPCGGSTLLGERERNRSSSKRWEEGTWSFRTAACGPGGRGPGGACGRPPSWRGPPPCGPARRPAPSSVPGGRTPGTSSGCAPRSTWPLALRARSVCSAALPPWSCIGIGGSVRGIGLPPCTPALPPSGRATLSSPSRTPLPSAGAGAGCVPRPRGTTGAGGAWSRWTCGCRLLWTTRKGCVLGPWAQLIGRGRRASRP